jgi:hypothetical protein
MKKKFRIVLDDIEEEHHKISVKMKKSPDIVDVRLENEEVENEENKGVKLVSVDVTSSIGSF